MDSESKADEKARKIDKENSGLTFTRKKGQGFKVGHEYVFRFVDTTEDQIKVQLTLPKNSKYQVIKSKTDSDDA